MSILTSGGKIVQVGGKGLNYLPPWLGVKKGDIIKMNLDGSDREYRVLKREGSVVEVLTMWDVSDSLAFDSNNTNTYAGNTLDTYLNTTWYNTLSTEAKNAIVPKNITQYTYQYYDQPNTPNTPTYTYQFQYDWSDSDYDNADKTAEVAVGDRYVYALDLKDIFDYYDKVCITSNELMTMFFNSTDKVSKYIRLRSAYAGDSRGAWLVYGGEGYVNRDGVVDTGAARGALQIDLSRISFTPPPIVNKGELITMNLDGTDRLYRVLKCEGNVAEVLGMEDLAKSVFSSSDTNTYAGGELDTYLNITWYNTLSTTAKNAIISKNITQYQYAYGNSAYNATTHASQVDYSTKTIKEAVGNRYVYALDIEDIENYFNSTFGKSDIWTLFWNITSVPSKPSSPGLRSANITYSNSVWYVLGTEGYILSGSLGNNYTVRPALTINLSKIPFTKSV